MQYGNPESVGMSSTTLNEIDLMAQQMISQKTTPGCQILVAKNGKIVYNKSFGHLRYDSLEQVNNQTLYDLASVTKIASTIP